MDVILFVGWWLVWRGVAFGFSLQEKRARALGKNRVSLACRVRNFGKSALFLVLLRVYNYSRPAGVRALV